MVLSAQPLNHILEYITGLNFLTYVFLLLTKYFSGDKIEKNEMGGACGKYGREERCIQGFGGET